MEIGFKYIVRYGIPGWFFIIFTFLVFQDSILGLTLKDLKLDAILGIFLTLLTVGVPIGYVFHYNQFRLMWGKRITYNIKYIQSVYQIIEEKEKYTNEDYYQIEQEWESALLRMTPEHKEYRASRFRHLLGTTHALGALAQSFLFTSILSGFKLILVILIESSFEFSTFFIAAITLILFLIIKPSYEYFTKNTMYYMASVIRNNP